MPLAHRVFPAPLVLLLALTALGCAPALGGAVDGGDAGRGPVPAIDAGADAGPGGDAGAPWKTFDELPTCDRTAPSLACIEQLFFPLDGGPWPFDAARVAAAMGINEFAVAPGWDLTAHHVLEGNLADGVYGCFFPAFRYAEDGGSFTGPGCGELLVAGGHPHAPECQASHTAMGDCVDEVPFAESFDLVVAKAPARGATLELAASAPREGDHVFAVGYPSFPWLTPQERAQLAPRYPLVSHGRVLEVEGRGLVVDAPALRGSSGGPLLDAHGKVLGVLSTLVGHQRARGLVVPEALKDHHVVVAVPDGTARSVVEQARAR